MKTLKLLRFAAALFFAYGITSGYLMATEDAKPMSSEQMRRLLQSNTNEYARMFLKCQQIVVESLESPKLKQYQLYRCLLLDPGMEEHNFVVAIREQTQGLRILTESIESMNAVIQDEKLATSTPAEALSLAVETGLLTRPYYKVFRIVRDGQECREFNSLLAKNRRKQRVVEPRILEQDKTGFEGELWLVIGRDLYQRKFKVSKGGVGWDDHLIERSVTSATNPHD